MHSVFRFLTAALVAALAGCATPSNQSTTAPAAPAGASTAPAADHTAARKGVTSPFELAKGMTADALRAKYGPADAVRPMSAPEGKAEVWVYTRFAGRIVRSVATKMHEVPVVDPVTGNIRMVQEPLVEQETLEVSETVELLMFNDQLIEWKGSQQVQRSFSK